MPYRNAAKKRWLTGICAVLAGLAAQPVAAAEQVDLELVITTDVSYSVDDMESRMQREGAVTAFRSPEVVEAIKSGSLGKIAVTYIDFSNANASRVVVDWQVVHDQATAEAFADAIAIARKTDGVQTSIASGIELAARLIEDNDFEGMKKVIDVSGDGPNNEGRRVDHVRDEVIAKGYHHQRPADRHRGRQVRRLLSSRPRQVLRRLRDRRTRIVHPGGERLCRSRAGAQAQAGSGDFRCREGDPRSDVREGRRRSAASRSADGLRKRLRYRRADALRRVYSTSVGRAATSAALEWSQSVEHAVERQRQRVPYSSTSHSRYPSSALRKT